MTEELKDLTTHYEFGQNWEDYSHRIDQGHLDAAVEGLRQLGGADLYSGRSILDIGCGSGVHALAALRLGASSVKAIDLDPKSVSTTQATLQRFHGGGNWSCEVRSVFNATPAALGRFDVVYSWGVLHHTGNMREAMRTAAELVKPGGHLVLAMYRKTALCGLWRREKAFYTRSPQWVRNGLSAIYASLFLGAKILTLRNPVRFIREYPQRRGMSFWTDVHDWMGGYPYESISPQEMRTFAAANGLEVQIEIARKRRSVGVFGSGCDQFVLHRPPGGSDGVNAQTSGISHRA